MIICEYLNHPLSIKEVYNEPVIQLSNANVVSAYERHTIKYCSCGRDSEYGYITVTQYIGYTTTVYYFPKTLDVTADPGETITIVSGSDGIFTINGV